MSSQSDTVPTSTTNPAARRRAHDQNNLFLDHFSHEIIRVLSQSCTTLTKLRRAINGSDDDRSEMGSDWADLWDQLRIADDGCVFLEQRIVLPDVLHDAFFAYVLAEHVGSQGMMGKVGNVWFPRMYYFLDRHMKYCSSCRDSV